MLKYKCSICGRIKTIHPSKTRGVSYSYTKRTDTKHYCDYAIEIYKSIEDSKRS